MQTSSATKRRYVTALTAVVVAVGLTLTQSQAAQAATTANVTVPSSKTYTSSLAMPLKEGGVTSFAISSTFTGVTKSQAKLTTMKVCVGALKGEGAQFIYPTVNENANGKQRSLGEHRIAQAGCSTWAVNKVYKAFGSSGSKQFVQFDLTWVSIGGGHLIYQYNPSK